MLYDLARSDARFDVTLASAQLCTVGASIACPLVNISHASKWTPYCNVYGQKNVFVLRTRHVSSTGLFGEGGCLRCRLFSPVAFSLQPTRSCVAGRSFIDVSYGSYQLRWQTGEQATYHLFRDEHTRHTTPLRAVDLTASSMNLGLAV